MVTGNLDLNRPKIQRFGPRHILKDMKKDGLVLCWRGRREILGEKKARFRSRGRGPKQESESSIACAEERMGRAMQEATADGSFDSSRNVFDDLYDNGDADIEEGTTFFR